MEQYLTALQVVVPSFIPHSSLQPLSALLGQPPHKVAAASTQRRLADGLHFGCPPRPRITKRCTNVWQAREVLGFWVQGRQAPPRTADNRTYTVQLPGMSSKVKQQRIVRLLLLRC